MKSGYTGKILRVNLDDGKFKDEKIPEETMRKFVGGFGLGLSIAYKECLPGLDPLDPDIPLVFTVGPLTATRAPSPTNTTITSINTDTGFTAGRSHSHGWFGIYLKKSGYDGIVIRGASESPVYMWINDGKIEIRDAKKFWGTYTHKAEDLIKEDVGNSKACVAAIGPGGENLVHGAIIQNDKHHSFSHSGFGTLMGSKKLKAIVTYGTKEVPVKDPERLKEIAKEWTKSLVNCEMGKFWIDGGKNAAGRHKVYEYDKRIGVISAKNFLKVSPPEWLDDCEDVAEISSRPCPGCPLGCSYQVKIIKGPYKGQIFTPGGGGENMEGPASMTGIYDTARIYYLVELEDNLGVEAGSIGCAMGLAFECFEKGLITKEDVGFELKWGDVEAVERLMKMIAYREGFGNILAEGAMRAADIIGGEAPNFVAHVKGGHMSHHDWRATWGVFFGQLISGASGWPAPGVTAFTTEPSLGYTEFQDPLTPEGKPEASRKTGMLKYWCDSDGVCWNAQWGVPNLLEYSTQAVSAVTGWDISKEEALTIGERVMNLERVFNVRHGLTPYDDIENIGPRLLEAPREGPAKGKSIKPYLRGMVREYYHLMGWDEKTGKPLRKTLIRLGLEEQIKDVWG